METDRSRAEYYRAVGGLLGLMLKLKIKSAENRAFNPIWYMSYISNTIRNKAKRKYPWIK